LRLPGLPGPDAADALGLAITHAHVGSAMERLRQAGGQAAPGGAEPLAGRYRSGRTR
jgi:crossover junction endodeoxyribonuclease RuvC